MSDLSREQFEAAVVERMKESGFLEVEIRVECLQRHGDGYQDGSIDSYWHFWQASREALVIDLPKVIGSLMYSSDVYEAVEAAGLKVKP